MHYITLPWHALGKREGVIEGQRTRGDPCLELIKPGLENLKAEEGEGKGKLVDYPPSDEAASRLVISDASHVGKRVRRRRPGWMRGERKGNCADGYWAKGSLT